MNKQTTSNALRIGLTILWRLMLTVAVVVGLCLVGVIMVMNTIFFGPSETARDTFALTMLESELTQDIPGKFLSEDLLAQIYSGATAEVGISTPGLIVMGTADPAQWAPYPDGIRTEMVTGKTYTAAVTLYQDPEMGENIWENVLLATPICNPRKVGGITSEGILLLADTAQALESDVIRSFVCGPVLMINGHANEALLAGSSGYAPYVAVGQRADGSVIRVVTRGWSPDYPGATYRDLINIMVDYGAVNACILGLIEE